MDVIINNMFEYYQNNHGTYNKSIILIQQLEDAIGNWNSTVFWYTCTLFVMIEMEIFSHVSLVRLLRYIWPICQSIMILKWLFLFDLSLKRVIVTICCMLYHIVIMNIKLYHKKMMNLRCINGKWMKNGMRIAICDNDLNLTSLALLNLYYFC